MERIKKMIKKCETCGKDIVYSGDYQYTKFCYYCGKVLCNNCMTRESNYIMCSDCLAKAIPHINEIRAYEQEFKTKRNKMWNDLYQLLGRRF